MSTQSLVARPRRLRDGSLPRSAMHFHRERGTPQGNVSSPHNQVSFFDIAPRALHLDHQAPTPSALKAVFHAPGPDGTPYVVGDMGYADDLVSTASTLPGL